VANAEGLERSMKSGAENDRGEACMHRTDRRKCVGEDVGMESEI
jgi:hypothetical protein